MKLFGKELVFNNNKVYHEGNKPMANDINFTDGETFQQKLDNGSLKGEDGVTPDMSKYAIKESIYTKEETDKRINELILNNQTVELWVGTKTEYDKIPTKNNTTLYFIKED